MFIDITERNFNTTKEIWENNGIKTYDIPLSAADCRVEGNDAIITLRLPHEDALYTDYASIMYWIQGDDGSEREESRAGLSVPSSCTMSVMIDDYNDVRAQFTSTVSGTAKGFAELRIHCESVPALEGLIAAPKAITYLRPMWYTGYGEDNALNPDRLTPDNTVVMEDMYDALDNSSLLEGRGQILNGKRYLFTFDEDEYYWNYIYREGEEPNVETFNIPMSPSFYEIIQKDGTENFTEDPNATGALRYDGKFIYTTSGCIYVKMKRMNYFHGEEVGYSSDEIEDVLNGNVTEYFDSTEALRGIINFFDTDEMININLRRNGLYLVSGTLFFNQSNICVIGHGSQIRAWNPITDGDGNYVLVGGSSRSGVENVEICDLSFKGLAKYENGAVVNGGEQCIKFQGYDNGIFFPINTTFFEVNIDGFGTGVHIINNATFRETNLNNRFIDCNISRTVFGYNFKSGNQILVSGGSVDNSLSTDKRHHCVYVSTGSSYITVENCVLKNSTGGAIHQMGSDNLNKMEHNNYRNLTIQNCYDGIMIAGVSSETLVEHIRGEKIGNFLYLGKCSKTVVKDYKATQLSSATIHVGTGTEAHDYIHTDHYGFFILVQYVDALIVDSVFDCEKSFVNTQDYPFFIANAEVSEALDSSKYDEGCIDNECAVVNLVFRNCQFFHKNSDSKDVYNYLGLQKDSLYCKVNVLYDFCEFNEYRRTLSANPLFYIIGRPSNASTYTLKNCKAYYSIEAVDDSIVSLGEGYYFFNKTGAILNILGNFEVSTSFRVNPASKSVNIANFIS